MIKIINKTTCIIAILVGVIILPQLLQAVPILIIEDKNQNNKDIGSFHSETSQKFTFTIKNRGNSPLVIKRIRTTCGRCLTVSPTNKNILPNQTQTLPVTIIAGTLHGKFTKHFFLETNDPKIRFTRFTITGIATPPITIQPSNKINCGYLPPKKRYTKTITITPRDHQKISFGVPTIKSPFKTSIKTFLNNGSLKIILTIKPKTKINNFNNYLTIPITGLKNKNQIKICISGSTIKNKFSNINKNKQIIKEETL